MLERLKTRPDFLRVARARRKWVTPGLILQVAPRIPGDNQSAAPISGEDGEGCRIGFTASRKVGGAVVRNRARRRLRQAAERVMPGQAAGGRDYVLIGRRNTIGRRFEDLVGDLETALSKLDARRDTRERTTYPT